jgi:formylglycine-generating enzyme required for sulfatase activity
MKKVLTVAVIGLWSVCATAASAISIETVPVGHPGNAPDSTGYGAVGYEYNIGKYEVTAGQYTAFLNAVAKTDTYGLYNMWMWYDPYGCEIKQTGSSGSYSYSVASDYANRPVNIVSWGDSARFANWLHNGQPTGAQNASTTENGAYTLNGATTDAALLVVTRKANAKWVIPSEDEWYKAAYHKNDGATGNYFDYSTSSDIVPSNDLISPDPGNNANFEEDGYTIGSPYYRTEVGEFENSDSPYGTFDQGGNVWEWNEAFLRESYRGLRGGSFFYPDNRLPASVRGYDPPTGEYRDAGFRVARVPEPGCSAILALGGLGMIRRKRR